MKKVFSALFMAIISVLVLFTFGQTMGENMTFWVIGEDGSFSLYHLDDHLNTEFILKADYISYQDGTAVYLEDDGFQWTLLALPSESDTPLRLAAGDSLTSRPVGFQMQIQDGYAYIPVGILDEHNSISSQYLLECSLDGSVCQKIYGLNFDIWNNFHVQNGKVYYVEMVESAPDHVMCYDLKTGELTCLTELDVVGFSWISFLDQDVLWRLTQKGNLSDPDTDTIVYATGYSLKDDSVSNFFLNDYKATDDTNFWVNDGFLYCFRNRRFSETGTVADLWKINAATGAETCVCTAIPYDNNFPPDVFFGKKGLILSDEVYDGENYIPTLKYISYDGRELVELRVPS